MCVSRVQVSTLCIHSASKSKSATMCKVIQYTFDCGHYLKLRESQCQGKFYKERRSGKKAACCAEAYLSRKLASGCGECQQNRWENDWNAKLERAKAFLVRLCEIGLPGSQEVRQEIQDMEDKHNKDAWDLRRVFPPLYKNSIKRVGLGTKVVRKSLLSREVRPEEVILESEREAAGEDDDGDDDDYVRSTDPFHPINTDYSYLDNLDVSWAAEFVAQNESELLDHADFNVGFDINSDAWGWNENDEPHSWFDNNGAINGADTKGTLGLVAWGPDVETSSSEVIGMGGQKINSDEDVDDNQVAEVLKIFREAMHADDVAHLSLRSSSLQDNQDGSPSLNGQGHVQSQHLSSPTEDSFHDTRRDFANLDAMETDNKLNVDSLSTSVTTLDEVGLSSGIIDKLSKLDLQTSSWQIGNSGNDGPSTSIMDSHIAQEPSLPIWVDGACDFPVPSYSLPPSSSPSTSPPVTSSPSTPERPKPKHFWSNKFTRMQHNLLELKDSDPHKYYALWLEICRKELMQYGGPEGRQIPIPQPLRKMEMAENST